MSTNAPPPLQIFRAGRHTAMNGQVLTFSDADLAATAAAYDPKKYEAPIVLGHPRHDGPAHGWVSSLVFADSLLLAVPHQVDPAFAELVSAGRFKKISASFYLPDSPSNPTPGVISLRHVGVLGAMPPAVKGMADAAFAEAGTIAFAADEAGVVTLEFGEWDDQVNAGLWRRMREWFIGQFGLDTADRIIPGYEVGTLEDYARQESADAQSPASPAFSESQTPSPITTEPTMTPEQIAAAQADILRREQALQEEKKALDAQNASFSERQAALAAQEAAAKRAGVVEFVEAQVKAGRVLPRDKAPMIEYMAGGDAAVLEFSEGDGGATKKIGRDDWFRQWMAGLPKSVEYGELSGERGGNAQPLSDAVIAARARQYHDQQAAAGNSISYAEAVDAVNAGLFQEGK